MLGPSLHLAPAIAAPRTPISDAEILESLPARADAPAAREIAQWRKDLRRDPRNAALALRLAQRLQAQFAAEGDPRYLGQAQAALAPWWTMPDPPPEIRVMRAVVLQFSHQFEPALADLHAAVRVQPDLAPAWAWIAAVRMVQARYTEARQACEQLRPLTSALNAASCLAGVDATTGRATAAAAALDQALRRQAAPADEHLFALTRLAEIRARLSDTAGAQTAFSRALELGIPDGYLLAAYSDFLLDQGRPREVLTLLSDRGRSDLLLLRLALAAKAAQDPSLAGHQASLGARFEAARLRGDTVHQKEEARFALQVLGDAARALPLAAANFQLQREPADARLLLEAALAAKRPAAAAPALAWLRDSGIESAMLRDLATRVEALK